MVEALAKMDLELNALPEVRVVSFTPVEYRVMLQYFEIVAVVEEV